MNAQEIHKKRPTEISELRPIARSGFIPAVRPRTDRAESSDFAEIVGYRTIFRSSPVALLVTSASGAILDASDSALRLLGLERSAVVGQTTDAIGLLPLPWHDRVPDSTDAQRTVRQVESRVTLKSGEERDLLVSIAPLHAGGEGAPSVMALVDVTGRRAAYEHRAHSDRLASMATLGAGVAHNINNPLTCVFTCLDLLDEHLVRAAPSERAAHERLKDLVDAAREGAQRVASIVRRMRMLASADARRGEDVDLTRVIGTAVGLTSAALSGRAAVVVDCQSAPLVSGDEASLVQIFVDILLNAARAIPAAGAERNEVHIDLSTDGASAVVVVRDTGAGMGPETRRRVFDPFFSGEPAATSVGLGLSICDRVLTGLGGAIAIESRDGAGTTVRVTIPARPSGDRPSAAGWSR